MGDGYGGWSMEYGVWSMEYGGMVTLTPSFLFVCIICITHGREKKVRFVCTQKSLLVG